MNQGQTNISYQNTDKLLVSTSKTEKNKPKEGLQIFNLEYLLFNISIKMLNYVQNVKEPSQTDIIMYVYKVQGILPKGI